MISQNSRSFSMLSILKMLSNFSGSKGLDGPDLPLPSGRKFQLSVQNSFHKVLTVEHTSPDHSTQVFIICHNGIRQIEQVWI